MITAVVMIVTTAAAATGLMWGAPSGLRIVLVASALGGLLAWDLADLNQRLRLAAASDDVSAIKRHHLVWLGLTAGVGLLLTTAAMLIPLHFSFAWTVLLALVAVLGMAWLVAWLYRV
ncbi:MAG: hypothetical protein JXM73_12695 [Anaerolineae bacterium]|nr:hypothetical protein [Anaerolineae bacterium]